MEGTGCDDEVDLAESASRPVRDVMRARPKTLAANATVGDLRRMFANPHVQTALLVDGTRFVGMVDREELDHLPEEAPARALARTAGVTIAPEATIADAMARLDETGTSRLAVIGPDGVTLEGLLCLNAGRNGFCR